MYQVLIKFYEDQNKFCVAKNYTKLQPAKMFIERQKPNTKYYYEIRII